MNAKRLFEDDDFLFADPSGDRSSHVELRVDVDGSSAITQREIGVAHDHLARVPRLAVPERDVTLLPLDHREGFLLSQVDGRMTVEAILDVSAMPAEEALEILQRLVDRGVLTIE